MIDWPDRERILPQLLPDTGWVPDWDAAIKGLCAHVAAADSGADLTQLSRRLKPLLTQSAALIALELGPVKPATIIRDQLRLLRTTPEIKALEALASLDNATAAYIDGHLQANDPTFSPTNPTGSPDKQAAIGRARWAFIRKCGEDLSPVPRRGYETAWSYIAIRVVDLLREVCTVRLVRTYDSDAERDVGWPLEFFRAFAAVLVAEPPALDKVWRSALESARSPATGQR